MKKFRFVFPKSAYALAGLICLSAIAGIVFSSLRFAEVGGFFSVLPALDVLTIVIFSVFLSALGWTLFGSYYAFTEEYFVVARLFFRHRIERESIVKMVIDEPSGVAAVYYLLHGTTESVVFVTVNLRCRDLDPFAEAFRAFRPEVPVEYNGSSEEK